MSSAERAYVGLSIFFGLVLVFYVVTGDLVQVGLWALMLLFNLVLLRVHRRQRQRRHRQDGDGH